MTFARLRVARSDLLLLAAVAAVVAAVAFALVSARPQTVDDRARSIEAQLRCPTCQGLSIADSPATSAGQMRGLVREQLASGRSDDEVRDFFVARYGRWILLAPPLAGPDLVLWFAPAVVVAVGAAVVVSRARAPRRNDGGRAASGWHAFSPGRPSRASTIVLGALMLVALVAPIVAAVAPRLAGREVSGGSVPRAAPSIEDLQAFVRAEPRDVGALVALGDALLAADRASEAADRYKAALELDQTNVSALLGLGAILLAADRPDAAGPVFDRMLTLSPDQPDALFYRAIARLRIAGQVDDRVRTDLERFLDVAAATDPRRAMATGLLAGAAGSPAPSSPPVGATPRP